MKRLLLLLVVAWATLAQAEDVVLGQKPVLTGTITTSSSAVTTTVTSYGVATVTVNGTYAGVTINFEFSDDGATWYSETCVLTDSAISEISEALPSNATRAWSCGVYATAYFRVRASAWTSGTANVGITLSAASIEPDHAVAGGVVYNSSPPTLSTGQQTTVQADVNGNTKVNVAAALPPGSSVIGSVTVNQTTSGTTNAVVPIPITGAAPAISNAALATLTASASVKASAGNVYGIAYANGAAGVCWVECVNSATDGTLGTLPLLSIPMGASATGTWTSEFPIQFSTGIACGIATAPGGNTACGTAGNITVFYK